MDMQQAQGGQNRLKGLLPPGVIVMRKGGSMGETIVNDVGTLSLPAEAGHVVVAILVKGAQPALASYERLIAQIGRSIYDYFLFA
jgi:hypothetical protein